MKSSCSGSANGVVFMTLEDETGIANIVVWPKVMAGFRKEVMGARLILVEGYIQSSPEHVTHLVAQRLFDLSRDLTNLANDVSARKQVLPYGTALNDDRRDHPDNPAQKIRHPRNVRILPPSRDFHCAAHFTFGRHTRESGYPVRRGVSD